MATRPTAIDLFSGCGGMSLGIEAAGFDVVASVEYDPIHALVHHFNFPYAVPICADVSQLSVRNLLDQIDTRNFDTEIDLVVGGPPCQGFSHIGKRQLDDPRNSLVFEYVKLIQKIRPKYFVFENVPGIGTGKHKQFLQEIISEFENLDYIIVKPVQILDSSHFGVAQKRKRLILLGSRKDQAPLNYPSKLNEKKELKQLSLFEDELNPLVTVEQAIGDLADKQVYMGYDLGLNAEELCYSGIRASFSINPQSQFALCHKRNFSNKVWGHLGSKHTATSIRRFTETKPGTTEKISRFYKLSPTGLCHTLRAGTASNKGAFTAPRPIHYSQPRCISIREAARLHSFPDWFQFHRTIWHGFREIGNAVTPLLAKAIGDVIIKRLEINKSALLTYDLEVQYEERLSYSMGQAASFWGVPEDVIPKRKRAVRENQYEQV